MASTGLRCLPTPAGSVLSRFYSTNAKRQQGRTAARYAVNYQTLKVSHGLRISVKQLPLALEDVELANWFVGWLHLSFLVQIKFSSWLRLPLNLGS